MKKVLVIGMMMATSAFAAKGQLSKIDIQGFTGEAISDREGAARNYLNNHYTTALHSGDSEQHIKDVKKVEKIWESRVAQKLNNCKFDIDYEDGQVILKVTTASAFESLTMSEKHFKMAMEYNGTAPRTLVSTKSVELYVSNMPFMFKSGTVVRKHIKGFVSDVPADEQEPGQKELYSIFMDITKDNKAKNFDILFNGVNCTTSLK